MEKVRMEITMKLLMSLAALALSAAPALAGGYYGQAGYGDGYYGGGETVVVTTRRVIHHAPPPPPVHVTRVVRYGYGHYGHGPYGGWRGAYWRGGWGHRPHVGHHGWGYGPHVSHYGMRRGIYW